eukprot:COSAG01_NODE_1683_length_9497_cov_33.408172_8_plen_84_part_00
MGNKNQHPSCVCVNQRLFITNTGPPLGVYTCPHCMADMLALKRELVMCADDSAGSANTSFVNKLTSIASTCHTVEVYRDDSCL